MREGVESLLVNVGQHQADGAAGADVGQDGLQEGAGTAQQDSVREQV